METLLVFRGFIRQKETGKVLPYYLETKKGFVYIKPLRLLEPEMYILSKDTWEILLTEGDKR